MKSHKCVDWNKVASCQCSSSALSPNDDCPKHGMGIFPPRCYECGKFIPIQESVFALNLEMNVRVINQTGGEL